MTPAEATRPVPIVPALIGALAIAAALSGCGGANGDPHRFKAMADQVAAIEVPLTPEATDRGRSSPAEASGLRPARFSAMKVAVMDPHAMWDARDDQAGVRRVADDAGLRDAVIRTAQPAVRAAAPDVGLRRPQAGRTIQLGAYSSAEAARQAWGRLKASADLVALTPVYESVQVQGRTLTRLKAGPVSPEAAAALCRAASVAEDWCARNG